MRKLRSVFFVLIPMLLLWGACDGLDPSPSGGQPEPPSTPEPVHPGRLVHVTGTSFSLGNGITDPYDSLFIHFDGKIVDSTIPHYDWITDVDYYYPENRKILNDMTLVLVFDGHQADCFGQANEYGFKVTGEDGTQSSVSVKIPVYDRSYRVDDVIQRMFLFNQDKELMVYCENGKKLLRMDCQTGEIIQEYDLSGLPGDCVYFTVNGYNGYVYIWNHFTGGYGFDVPTIWMLDPESGEFRVSATIPKEEDIVYQPLQPADLAFTKYGTGVLVLRSSETSSTCVKVVETASDGTLTLKDPDAYPGNEEFLESLISYMMEYNTIQDGLSESQDGSYLYCLANSAYYVRFEGEDCRFIVDHYNFDHKVQAVANKKNGVWLMRELYDQYLLYPDGSTSPHWSLDSRHEGKADFCYTPGYENLVINYESTHFKDNPAGIYYADTTTGEIVFYKKVLGGMMDFQTTADGKSAFSYRREYSASGDYSHSQIFVFDMPYLLSHCRL
jgi:hypothetical protein